MSENLHASLGLFSLLLEVINWGGETKEAFKNSITNIIIFIIIFIIIIIIIIIIISPLWLGTGSRESLAIEADNISFPDGRSQL